MLKWNEPKGPPPAWLSPAREVTHDDPKLGKSAFIVACVDQLVALGFSVWAAVEATANALNETGWGQHYRANNLGGWKITRAGAMADLVRDHEAPLWWRAPGNRAPGATLEDYKGGDPPWCYYRAFPTIGDYLARWMRAFVPHPPAGATRAALEAHRHAVGDYRLTGLLFAAGDPAWFVALCHAGYKGTNTAKAPEASYAEHAQLVVAARTRWAQTKLAVDPDGAWGAKSAAACRAFQTAHGLPASGEPDPATLAALAV